MNEEIIPQRCEGPRPGVVKSGFLTPKLSAIMTKFLVFFSLMTQRAPSLSLSGCHEDFTYCAIAQMLCRAFTGMSCLPFGSLVTTGALKLMHYK